MKIARSIDAYMTSLTLSRTASPETARLYALYLRRFLEFRRAHHITRDVIPPGEIHAFLDWYNTESIKRRSRPLSAHAYDKIFDTMRAYCNWASDLGRLRVNPFRFLKPPKVPRTMRTIAPKAAVDRFLAFVEQPAPLAGERICMPADRDRARKALELERFRARAIAVRDAAFYATMFYAGLRISEACPIALVDLDLGAGYITVKNGKGGLQRVVPIRLELRRYLLRWLRIRKKLLDRFEISTPALFPSLPGHGRPWRGEARAIKPAWMIKLLRVKYLPRMRARGAPRAFAGRFTPHAFRHSVITWMLNAGVPLAITQRFAGHADPGTTMIYYNQLPADIKRATARA